MFGYIKGRLRCFKGKHERSDRFIERAGDDERYISKCRFCGVPMKRRAKRDWVIISRAQYRAERAASAARRNAR